jgi:phenylacetate-CoA ligase
MVNGGHYVREAVPHWTGAQFLSAGTGVETRSGQQVALMRDFGATVIVGFGGYIKRLSEVAHEEGMVPGEDIRIRMISGHMGAESHASMSAAWGGAEVLTGTAWATPGPLRAKGRTTRACMCRGTRSTWNCSTSKPARRWPRGTAATWW